MTEDERLALDLMTVVLRVAQIDAEGPPDHWLWYRVMTCDVPRLVEHASRLSPQTVEKARGMASF